MTSVSQRVATLFNVQPGEATRVLLMMLYSAAAVGAVGTVLSTVSSALFLSTVPPSQTAYLLVLGGFGVIPALLLYDRVARPFSMEQIAPATALLLLGVVLLLRLLLSTPLGTTVPVLGGIYYFREVATLLLMVQFWRFAAEIFNARAARRLFGLIAGGGALANIVTGYSLATLSRVVGVPNLLFIVAAGLAVCAACTAYLGRYVEPLPVSVSAPAASLRADVRLLLNTPLLRAIALMMILQALVLNTATYQFYLALQNQFAGQSAAMVTFLGHYEVVAGIVALTMQFYLVGRIMNRYGLLVALALLPVSLLVTEGVALLAGGAILAMALVRATSPAISKTISDAARSALYLPLPREQVQQVNALMTMLFSIIVGLLGVLFALLPTVSGKGYLVYAIPVALFSAVWLLMLPGMRRHYIQTLRQSINTRRLTLDEAPLELEDETTRAVLLAALQHPDELQALHALQLVSTAPHPFWLPHLSVLLRHPSPAVQGGALRYLEAHGTHDQASAVATLFDAPQGAVRAAALRAFCALAGDEALTVVPPFLADDIPQVRAAAVVGLILHTGMEGILQAGASFKEMLASADPAMRGAVARLLGELELQSLRGSLLVLLDDPVLSVRQAAIESAARLRHPDLLPALVAKLGAGAEALAAGHALEPFGEAAIAPLDQLLAAPQGNVAARVQAVDILRRIGTPQAGARLRARLGDRNGEVRGALYRALAEMQQAGRMPALPVDAVNAAIQGEIRQYYEWYLIGADVAREHLFPLLQEALARRQEQVLDRLLDLLGLRYGTQQLGQVRRALAIQGGSTRAMAIELLDNVAERELKELLLPLVEGPESAIVRVATQRFGLARCPAAERLASLLEQPDPWLRSTVLYHIGEARLAGFGAALAVALADTEPLVRESAGVATRALWVAPQSSRVGAGLPIDEADPMLSTIECILLLKAVEFFQHFASEALLPVARVMQQVTVERGERFITQGDVGTCLYILAAGEASIVIRGVGEVARRGPRAVIGEMAVISHQPRAADCVALSPIRALRLDYDAFWELLTEKPRLAEGVIQVLARRLDEAVANLQRLSQGAASDPLLLTLPTA